ncbi:MAG: chaperone NapD [bacterium]|nr:chaperone NapD [bacterium]
MAVVGAFARIDLADPQAVRDRLAEIAGITLFDLDDPGKVGLVIEADDLDRAHAKLCAEIERVSGVLGVWPVYAHDESDSSNTGHQVHC